MTSEPRVNLHRLAANIVLDATLLRWFSYNGRRDEVMAAIEVQRTRAKDTEGKSWTSWSATAEANDNKQAGQQ